MLSVQKAANTFTPMLFCPKSEADLGPKPLSVSASQSVTHRTLRAVRLQHLEAL